MCLLLDSTSQHVAFGGRINLQLTAIPASTLQRPALEHSIIMYCGFQPHSPSPEIAVESHVGVCTERITMHTSEGWAGVLTMVHRLRPCLTQFRAVYLATILRRERPVESHG